ncbi:hypothetical protein [Leptospira santarosai]|uniref:Uncharacterized protein n=2 Tax=Leptospira santarosai TaxID=28183 RepID=A0A2P1QSR7_9LEPT|nr:hypothetical protein [Leptospira santarosai]AVQ11933.1 Uncharacterized protein XB16_1603 [Leptospira santarosai]AVV80997.1 Uncharacterized protein XB15_03258 [Leptospira santarosai]EKT85125.1 hypothetical protein LSS_19003 [Leptospira santarosai serovar Shermani str. LT 821]MDI7189121.1 hypothetical protein [Leptospira santarosai]ONF83252.1 hypothetical protein BWD13_19205 [Leptospira santarosai serovar Grippotyphosa]
MEMATEKTRSIAINDAMIDKLVNAFENSLGIKPTNRNAVELAVREKIEQLEKQSKRSPVVAKNR